MDFRKNPFEAFDKVKQLKSDGKSNKEIASLLNITLKSGESIVSRLYKLSAFDPKILKICRANNVTYQQLDRWILRKDPTQIDLEDFVKLSGLEDSNVLHLKSAYEKEGVVVQDGTKTHLISANKDKSDKLHLICVDKLEYPVQTKSPILSDVQPVQDSCQESSGKHLFRDESHDSQGLPPVQRSVQDSVSVQDENLVQDTAINAVQNENPVQDFVQDQVSVRSTVKKLSTGTLSTADKILDWTFGDNNKVLSLISLGMCVLISASIVAMSYLFFQKLGSDSKIIPVPLLGVKISVALLICILMEIAIPILGKIGSKTTIVSSCVIILYLTVVTMFHSFEENHNEAQEARLNEYNHKMEVLRKPYLEKLAEYEEQKQLETEILAEIKAQISVINKDKDFQLSKVPEEYLTRTEKIVSRTQALLDPLEKKKDDQLSRIRALKKPVEPIHLELNKLDWFEGWTPQMWLTFLLALMSRVILNGLNLIFARNIKFTLN